MEKPIVSICCITYNHVNFISESIEGFLIQKTTFPIEILIFDDASTDGTQEIVRKYASKDIRIKTFLQSENQWSKQKYGLIDWLFPAAQGKYIAICEGDDYWTDPFKLQKQVDFLEGNPKFSMCFHKISYLNGDLYLGSYYKTPPKDVLNARQVINRHYIATSSLVFRRNRLSISKKIYSKAHLNDIYLEILLSFTGLTYYFNEEMGVYNKNISSISHNREYLKNGRNQLILIYSELFCLAPYKYKVHILIKLLYNYLGKIKDHIK